MGFKTYVGENLRVLRKGMSDNPGDKNGIIHQLQAALNLDGAELVVDGGFGLTTETALMMFQARHYLSADGVVGTNAAKVLDEVVGASKDKPVVPPMPSVLDVAPHLAQMRAMTGTKEIPGSGNNPAIIKWARDLEKAYPSLKGDLNWYKMDSIAWCGLAMGAAVGLNPVTPVIPPPGLLGAQNWKSFGVPLSEPTPGAILVYSRTGGGHVTLYESELDGYFYCRGGNQSDMVNVSKRKGGKVGQNQLLAIRWPKGIPVPTTGRKIGATANAVAAGKES